MRLIIHNFYSKKNPSGENKVVQLEKKQFTHTFFAFSDTPLSCKSLLKRYIAYFQYKIKVKNRLKRILNSEKFDEIVLHNTFPFIGDEFMRSVDPDTKIIIRMHNYRSLVTCGILSDRNGNYCDLCLRKPVRFSPMVLIWRCYNGSLSKSLLVYIKIIKLYLYQSLHKVDEVRYFSEFQKNLVKKLFKDDVVWQKLPNKISVPKRVPTWINKGPKNKYVFIGRLSNEKGLKILIDTWVDWKTEIELDVYGSGPLERLLKEKSKYAKINFMGYLDIKNKYKVMRNGSILLFPSQCIEGHPLIIEESKVIKMPGLVSHIGPLKEFTEHSNLKLLDFSSPNLRSILSKFYNDTST